MMIVGGSVGDASGVMVMMVVAVWVEQVQVVP